MRSSWMSARGRLVCAETESPRSGPGAFLSLVFGEALVIVDLVVGRFLHDADVVNMTFAHARRGDLHEVRLGAQVIDGRAAGVAHAGTQPAHHLVHDRIQ